MHVVRSSMSALQSSISVADVQKRVVWCNAVSPTWRYGKEEGLFPDEPLCNSHGALDMRGRLHLYLEAQVCF